ncbi:hypothetical protein HUJ05_001386 [Dendroctonus ponderosae]|nr:hypothetical protein HUJ05_001386 [Dendroctonus ponderosae]
MGDNEDLPNGPRISLRLALTELNESISEGTPNKSINVDELLVLQRGPRKLPITWSPVDYDSLITSCWVSNPCKMNAAKEETDPDFGGNPAILDTNKSSMQILSELFSTFDAEPPVIVKKEKSHEGKKSKKSKKKRKHKEKKHKKKSKKKKRSSNSSSNEDSEVDLAHLLIKQEKDKADEKIKIEGTSLSLDIKLEINKEDQTFKSEINTSNASQSEKNREDKTKQKIRIKDIQLSSINRKQKHEEGEITDSDSSSKKKKRRHKAKDRLTKRKSSSGERGRHKKAKYEKLSPEREKHKSRHDYQRKERSRSRSRDHFYHDRHRDEYKYEHRARYRDRESPFRDDGFYKSREREKSWLMREKCRDYEERDRSFEGKRERSKQDSSRIDKKKLLEIARKNAIQMMKSGSLPGALNLGSKAQEKMIAAIKTGGKSIDELTDFCKSLSKKEELGELSSLSEKEDTDNDEPFHHPFKLKDRPTTITMNIKNSVPLPTKTTHERTTELRIQFPVSSGQQHRVNEEWIPVGRSHTKAAATVEAPKPKAVPTVAAALAIEAPPPPVPLQPSPALIAAPPNAPPGPQVFPTVPPTGAELSSVDLGSIVSQRLTAMRKLQENPHDVQALSEMYKSNQEMDTWAKSKQQLGQFTGSTGVQVLSQAELASGYQAWAKKNQLQTAAPVSGGMGMHLLQKMGWKPGEGLGKEKTGTLEPLLLEVKLDKKGLVANEEQKGKKKVKAVQTVKTLQGKHPVSLLGEYASKRKLGAPQYVLEFECGPDHKKNFLFKVVLNGMEYKPNVASANKKEAKAHAATMALKQIGLLV